MMDLRTADLARLNSITKYPSIATLHALGDKGVPTDEVQVDFTGCTVDVTEKVDGTNARILLAGHTFAIGSRENLLTVSGDVLFDPAQDIVVGCRPAAATLARPPRERLTVVYGELYGGKVTGGSKQYTGDRTRTAWRVFDVIAFEPDRLHGLLAMFPEEVARWREGERHDFMESAAARAFCGENSQKPVPVIARVEPPPTERSRVLAWLGDVIPESLARIDNDGGGKAEGVVVRTADRSRIAKVRFEDYRKVR